MDDYIKQRIAQLEAQLKQAQGDLKSDEEIFKEKEKELIKMRETIGELESKLSMASRCLEASMYKEKEQQELMLQLQLQVDRLLLNNKMNEAGKLGDDSGVSKLGSPSSMTSSSSTASKMSPNAMTSAAATTTTTTTTGGGVRGVPPLPQARAKTAPQSNNLLTTLDEKNAAGGGGGNAETNENGQKNRRAAAYSSPAVFTMEKFMQNFRARSQLLAETLEVFFTTWKIKKNKSTN